MRTNSSMTKKTFRKIASLITLALCFAVAFTVTLAVGYGDGISNAATATLFSEWKTSKNSDEMTLGTAGAIPLDGSDWDVQSGISAMTLFRAKGNTSASDWNYATSWGWNVILANMGVAQGSDGKPANIQGWKAGGGNSTELFIKTAKDENNGNKTRWYAGVYDRQDQLNVGFEMLFAVPPSILALAGNSNFTVTAYLLMDYYRWQGTLGADRVWAGILPCTVNSPIGPGNHDSSTKKGWFGYPDSRQISPDEKYDGSTEKGKNIKIGQPDGNSPITLTSKDTAISFGIVMNIPRRLTSGENRWIEFGNLRMRFEVSLNTPTDNDETAINDGSAPVKVAEALGATIYDKSDITTPPKYDDDRYGYSTVGNNTVEAYQPYIANAEKMPIYHPQIQTQLSAYIDKGMGTNNVSLNSFTNSPLDSGVIKWAKVEFADTFNYEGLEDATKSFNAADATSDSNRYGNYAGIGMYGKFSSGAGWSALSGDKRTRNLSMASGIKQVTITISPAVGKLRSETNGDGGDSGQYTFLIYNGGGTKNIYLEDNTDIGFLTINKLSRANVNIEVQLKVNANVTIEVRDYGDRTCQSYLQFGGIDLKNPDADEGKATTALETEGYTVKDVDNLGDALWFKREQLVAGAISGETDDDGAAPYLWYYSVKKASSANALGSPTAYSSLTNRVPIAYGSFSQFQYDFKTGQATVPNVKLNDGKYESYEVNGGETGVGYYMFAFYKVDLAGNVSSYIATEYIKVDYEVPNFNTAFTYTLPNGSESSPLNIYDSLDRVQWATGVATFKINIPKVNFSGNTLIFEDVDGKTFILTFDNTGEFELHCSKSIDDGNGGKTSLLGRGSSASDSITAEKISTYIDATDVYFKYKYDQHATNQGVITVTFEGANAENKFPTVAWSSGFRITTVKYANYEAMDGDDEPLYGRFTVNDVDYAQSVANLFIDRHNPAMPLLEDDYGYLKKANADYTINLKEQLWKTDGYLLDTMLTFADGVADIDIFAPYIKVYTGFINVSTPAEFAALQNKPFITRYGEITNFDKAKELGFERLSVHNMVQLSNETSPYRLEFFSSNGAGMRVMYTWVVDQAGRVSSLYTSYVLIDTTAYSVSAQMLEAVIGDNNFGANGTITFANENGVATTRFGRGETVIFTLTLKEGYVPYTFNKGAEDSSLCLLKNITPNKVFTKTDNLSNFVKWELGDEQDSYVISFKIDDNNSFGAISSDSDVANSLIFSASARKTVTKTPEYNKYYDATRLDMVKQNYVKLSDDRALEYLDIKYYPQLGNSMTPDLNNELTYGNGGRDNRPLDVGTYFVAISIPEDNPAFVLKYAVNESAQNRTVPTAFVIVQGRVTVTPDATVTQYGEKIALTYTSSGFIAENATEEELVVNLALDYTGWNTPGRLLDVGRYAITGTVKVIYTGGEVSNNYVVEFDFNQYHTVIQRSVEIKAFEDSKQYGDPEPSTLFAVDATSQFDWYDGSKDTLIKEIIFNGYTFKEKTGNVYTFDSNGRITRQKGENKGTYPYSAQSSAFDVNNNYAVSVNLRDGERQLVFTINARQIVLDVSGQSKVVKYSEFTAADSDITTIAKNLNIGYTLNSKDVGFAELVANSVALALGTPVDHGSSTGYKKKFKAEVILNSGNDLFIENGNIQIVLANDHIYTIYVSEPGAAVIRLKEGAKIEFVYGKQTFSTALLSYDNIKDYVEVLFDEDAVEFDTVEWTCFNTKFVEGSYLDAGVYIAYISDAKLKKNGSPLGNTVIVESFNVTVNPAVITVAPTYTEDTREYGAQAGDGDFGIGKTIKAINGKELQIGDTYIGLGRAALLANISGAFARGCYAKTGEFRYAGGRFDDVTDDKGIVHGTDGDYYAFYVSAEFKYNNNNFVVEADLSDTTRFKITPKTINLNVAGFVGISKAWDETVNVNFGNTVAYDILQDLARPSDNVTLAFDAVYTDAGKSTESTRVGIKFTNIRLSGDQAYNYALGEISIPTADANNATNGNELSNASGDIKTSTDVTSDVTVTIYYLDNSITNISNRIHIEIKMGAIAIRKSDFTVSKVYDGNDKILEEDISILSRADGTLGGSTMLAQLWTKENANAVLESDTATQNSDAGDYRTNIQLRFNITGIKKGDVTIANGSNPNYIDPDIRIDVLDGAIVVQINNIKTTILQKVLGVKSFTSIKPQDQDYRGNNPVVENTEIVLGKEAAVAGDKIEVRLTALINDGNCDAGVHTVKFAEMGRLEDNDKSYINNNNYTIDIDALNDAYKEATAKTVTVNKAKLKPNINFVGREYDGSSNVDTAPTNSEFTCDFITEHFAAELKDELSRISFNTTAVRYLLSDKGKENPNVVIDEFNKVVAHNVLVQNMIINVSDGSDILKNYCMFGGVYDEATKSYKTVDAEADKEFSYEILGAVKIDRKAIRLLANNIVIKNKVYDGKKDATVIITLDSDSGVVAGQEELLTAEATGTFDKHTVGKNIPVKIENVRLAAKDDANAQLVNNYSLAKFSERRSADIVARPVGFELSLGDKTYNGDTQISTRDIEFKLLDMIETDRAGYAVQTLPGYSHFVDKNVAREGGDPTGTVINKQGTVLSPILRNNRGTVNYQLAIYKTELDGDDYFAYIDLEGNLRYDEKAEDAASAKGYYYALPTADKYIVINETNATLIESAKTSGAVVGTFTFGNEKVHAIDSKKLSGENADNSAFKELNAPMTYIEGEGKILPKAVMISASHIDILKPLEKLYDGTTHFFGVRGIDYQFGEGSISGAIEGDDISVSAVEAQYETAYTTCHYVIFKPSAIDGADKGNYVVDDTVGYALKEGRINPRPIKAKLEDGTIEYGTAINSVVGNISYYMEKESETGSEQYMLTEWNGGLYMQFTKYTEFMGFGIGNYYVALRTRMYAINMQGETLLGFDKIAEDATFDDNNKEQYYIRLSGISSLPTAKATFMSSNPSAGDTASYRLLRASGYNYVFEPVYTDTEKQSSVLTVVRKDLFVSTLGRTYSKYYAGNEPAIELFFLDINGGAGFAPGETAYNVFRIAENNYAPVVVWGIYDSVTESWTPLDEDGYKYAKLTGEGDNMLGAGKSYMAKLALPEGMDKAAYDDIIKNYNVVLPNDFVVEGEDGNKVIKLNYKKSDTELYSLTTQASKLEIVLPPMGGVTLRGTENNTYAFTFDSANDDRDHPEKRTNFVEKVLLGIMAGDTITLSTGQEAINVGTYTGRINVTRPIKVDNGDENGYTNFWESAEEVTINVNPASPELKVVTSAKYYDGESFVYAATTADAMISYIGGHRLNIQAGYVDISYAVLQGNEYVPVQEMRDAGVYRVTVKFNNEFANNNPNYIAETATATYTILKAPVTVNISNEGFTEAPGSRFASKTLVAEYDASAQYDIKYTISNSSSLPQQLRLPITQTKLEFEKEISSAGRYAFAVKLVSGDLDINNYRLVNESGVLELTTKKVETSNAVVTVDTSVVANRLVAKEITPNTSTGTENELWNKVNDNMPFINKQARLAAIVKLGLYCDNVLIEYKDGNMNVSVKVPENVGDMSGKAIYTVTAEGGLKRLESFTVTEDGRLEYVTDYLGAIVFVEFSSGLALWQIILIAVGATLVAIAAIWTTIALIVRKSRLKKLA